MYGKGLSVSCVPFYPCGDRFVTRGYRSDPYTVEQKLEKIAKLGDVTGVELSYPDEFEDPVKMAKILQRAGLKASNLEVDIFGDPKWKYGALSSRDDALRAEAIALACRCMDAATTLGCDQISIWAGQDGFDYPMQIDYREAWDRIIDAVRQIATHRRDVRIAIEYKIKEPRTHIHFATIGKVLLAALETEAPNVGVMIDFGHATMAYENVAESAVLAHRHGRLYHLHLNDNFGLWDDDMIVGSVHLWETFELFYTLECINYNGWYSLDIFPYREDSLMSIRTSLDMVKKLVELARRVNRDQIADLQRDNDAVGMVTYLRKEMLR
ncbi:MAG: sugar phosphate isomerase/epimerase family protein [Bacteroidales bacterium]|nr:sugar phosphate isomerase/epimerase family protein [Bacteroidales bacterium]